MLSTGIGKHIFAWPNTIWKRPLKLQEAMALLCVKFHRALHMQSLELENTGCFEHSHCLLCRSWCCFVRRMCHPQLLFCKGFFCMSFRILRHPACRSCSESETECERRLQGFDVNTVINVAINITEAKRAPTLCQH